MMRTPALAVDLIGRLEHGPGTEWQYATLRQPPVALIPSLVDGICGGGAKLIILLNAFTLTREMSATLIQRASADAATLVVLHAAGVVPSSTGRFDPHGASALLGAGTLKLGSRDPPMALKSVFVKPAAGAPKSTPEWSALFNSSYGEDLAGLLPVAPWWYCESDNTECTTVAVFAEESNKSAGCWCDRGTHRTLFMALPGLPISAWRGLAVAAGVHVWASGNGSGAFVDAVELSANTLVTLRLEAPSDCRITLPREQLV